MPGFRKILDKYKQKETQAYIYVKKSDIEYLLLSMGDYIHYPLLRDKIASFIKIAYLKKFLNINKEDVSLIDWRGTLEHYALYFGVDGDLKIVAKRKGIEKDLNKVIVRSNFLGYRKYDFSEDILKFKTQEQLQIQEQKTKEIKKDPHMFHLMLIGAGVVVFILLAWIMLKIFEPNIQDIKEERKKGPYKGFETIYNSINNQKEEQQ